MVLTKEGRMRDYKFRAWYDGAMYVVYEIDIACGFVTIEWADVGYDEDGTDYPIDQIEVEIGDAKLMQYTGLKDKNGVEIYEGDVIQYIDLGTLNIESVEWSNGSAGFWPFSGDIGDHARVEAQYCEVIGNAFENPAQLREIQDVD